MYEVIPVYAGRLFRLREHLDRLNNSLSAIRMAHLRSHAEWLNILQELIRQNGGGDQYLYLQISRGAEFGRNHAWPEGLTPTVFAYCSPLVPLGKHVLEQGVAAITAPDQRWARRDIKSTALLANVLAKKLAVDAGAYETILLDQGELTEGSSTTVHVIWNQVIHTPPNGHDILPGTTRDVVSEMAQRLNIPCVSVPVAESQLRAAEEIWLAFSTRGILPVTRLDGEMVGAGQPGPLFKRLNQAFSAYIHDLTDTPPL